MVEKSSIGIVVITVLSALMLSFSYIYYLSGETFIPLILIFAGLILAAIVAITVIFSGDSNRKQ